MRHRFKLDRFSLVALLRGVDTGLRERRQFGEEPPDRNVRRLLVWVPFAVFVLAFPARAVLQSPTQLTSAFGLMSGALLAIFSLIARWREDLTRRDRKTDAVTKRHLDETVSLILMSCLASALGAAITVLLSTFQIPGVWSPMRWVALVLSASGLAVGAFLLLNLVIVVHLLWEAYTGVNKRATEEAYPRSDKGRGRAS